MDLFGAPTIHEGEKPIARHVKKVLGKKEQKPPEKKIWILK
jgi:hypothetical protein